MARLIHLMSSCLTLLILNLAPPLVCQGAGATTTGAVGAFAASDRPQGAARAELLGAGDTLAIDVGDMPEVSTRSIKIGSDGLLDLPMVGMVRAAGLTVSQLRSELGTKLSRFVNDPVITINVLTNASRFVSVLGEVNSPGLQPLDGPRSLVQAISAAGGVKTDAGPRVIVTRDQGDGPLPSIAGASPVLSGRTARLSLSLNDLLSSASPDSNIDLLPGDTVSVPKEQLVYVVGDVHRPGGFPMSSRESVSVLQVMSLAEGSNPNASLQAAKILRPAVGDKSTPVEVPIDLSRILAGKAPDQPLFANDVLFVPKSAAKSGTKRAAEIMLQVATGVAIYR